MWIVSVQARAPTEVTLIDRWVLRMQKVDLGLDILATEGRRGSSDDSRVSHSAGHASL